MANQDEIMQSGDDVVGRNQVNQSELTIQSTSDLKNKIRLGLVVVGVVIVAIVAVVYYNKSKDEKEREASAALSRIRAVFDSGDYAKAMSGDPTKMIRDTPLLGLKDIVDQFGSSENGKVAALYAGNSLVGLKKYDEAVSYFEKAQGSSSMEVSVGAMIGLGICKENQKDYVGAAELYENAAARTVQPSLKDKYKLYAALSFEKSNNKEKAEKLYRDILHGETMELIGESKSGLTRLGMIVE
jgi:tetratricopeptide (TPR) repeat protein